LQNKNLGFIKYLLHLFMKKALVFGGNGFLGLFVIKELCEKDFEVLIVSRSNKGFEEAKILGFPGQVNIKKFDVSNLAGLNNFDFSKFDLVINLIGIGLSSGKNTYPSVHVEFPSLLAGMLRKVGVKFIHISAFTGETNINSVYVKTKREGETAVLKNNPKAIIIRPSVMLGKGGSLVQTFEKLINFSPIIPLPMGGKMKFQPVFAGDVAKFIVLAAQSLETQGKAFNLAGEEVILFKEFIERICGFMNKRRILIYIPFFVMMFLLKIKLFLPKFFFRTSITADVFAISKQNLVAKSDLKLLIAKPYKIDDILSDLLEKYTLYE
jgi:NADH dehydrogenase